MKSKGIESRDGGGARPITNLKISAVSQKQKADPVLVKKEKTEERVIKCHICEFTTSWAAALKEHMKNNHGEQMFKCLQTSCGKRYPKKKQLLRHVGYKHKDEPVKTLVEAKSEFPQKHSVWCNECGKGFCNGSSLRMHMMLHSGEKPFSCDLCGKGFAQKGNMVTHRSKCTEATINTSAGEEIEKEAEKISEEETDPVDVLAVDDVDLKDMDEEERAASDDNEVLDNDDATNAPEVLEEVTEPASFHEST